MNIAFSHDWLTGMRGGERVLELLCREHPAAPIHTLIHNRTAVSEAINRHPITTSFLQRMPGIFQTYRYYLPMFPLAERAMRAPADTDVLVSTSHCVAKGLPHAAGTRHLCYCFTPMRYAWLFFDEYFGGGGIKRAAYAPLLAALRRWDLQANRGVDRFVAISEHVRARIQRFYGREADVVYPPVNTMFYTPEERPREDFDLVVSALVPYKRIDLAIAAYNRLQRPLKIVGIGMQATRLKQQAGPNIEFLGWQSDEAIRDLYRRARCLVFPGEEDFGIVPVEAQACGCPVVAYAKGGALETIAPDVSGVFFAEQNAAALIGAIETCAARRWDVAAIRAHAEKFSEQKFLAGFRTALAACGTEASTKRVK